MSTQHTTAVVSRWAQRFLVASGVFLVAAQVGALAGLPGRTEVVLGLHGFVLFVVFGKAYSLIPSYFARDLVWPRAIPVHFALSLLGTGSLALSHVSGAPAVVAPTGAIAWGGGVLVFVSTIGVTVRGNLTGNETATGESKADRAALDRFANAFVPVALAYLIVGSYELVGAETVLPTVFDGYYPRIAHLLAAGFALLLLFSIGARLLPRLLATSPPGWMLRAVLVAGAVGPVLVAIGLPAGTIFRVGAVLEAFAVGGFAVAYAILFVRTDRTRVGIYGPLAGVCAGLAGVGLGLWFAVGNIGVGLSIAHLRLNVFGLLGLSVVGVVFQFYPPAIGDWPATGDKLAMSTILVLSLGIALAASGALLSEVVERSGQTLVAVAGATYLYLLVSVIRTHAR